ncbi:DUF4397 domain-containing protein [Bacillus spongiae]|uniref:DUF4397 domain-containing protein n=1 Tax=Bacillus spongiae TaxID=2683610 RepID=A0ABU8HDP0_9BACI
MNYSHKYLEKAAFYDLLAHYYKYTDPNKHIHYYQKHLDNMNKALQSPRSEMTQYAHLPAYVRFLHASPDSMNVDVFVNGKKVLKNIAFKEVSDYLTFPTGKYHIDIYPTGDSVTTIISKKIAVEEGKIYTYTILGTSEKLQLLPYEDKPRVHPNETKIRSIHLSPDAPAVDIAVKGGDVVFPNISFKQATDYLPLSPMPVDLEARIAGTNTVALSIPTLTLRPNESYTVLIVGFVDGEPPLESLVIKG